MNEKKQQEEKIKELKKQTGSYEEKNEKMEKELAGKEQLEKQQEEIITKNKKEIEELRKCQLL